MKTEEVFSWDNFVKALETIKDMAPEEVEAAAEAAIKQLNDILSEVFTPETLEEAKSILEQFFSPELMELLTLPPNMTFEPINPVELLPGRTYVIETEHHLNEKAKDRLLSKLHFDTRPLNCRFIILDGGLKIARG